jgi:hypothetical protein
MMTGVYWELVEAFFGAAVLHTSMHVMMAIMPDHTPDFFVSVCAAVMTQPIVFGFTEHGLQPVQARPELVIPYSEMSRAQLELAARACAEMDASGFFASSTMLGSGFYMQSLDGDKHYVPHALALQAATRLLDEGGARAVVCDVVMSRLTGYVVGRGGGRGHE